MKTCCRCLAEKAETEFHRSSRNRDGRIGHCKACHRRNRQRENETKRANRTKDGERERLLARKRYAANPEKHRKRCREWREANPEKQRAACAAWVSRNREQANHHNSQRRGRLHAANGKFTLAEWKRLCDQFGGKCAYCRKAKKLTRHHVVPLSRGGANDIANIVPACQSCNSRVGTKTVLPETR